MCLSMSSLMYRSRSSTLSVSNTSLRTRRDCKLRPPCAARFQVGSRSESRTISSKCSDVQPSIADRIDHIAAAIGSIREIVAGQTPKSFADSMIARLAVERLLEIISEASRFIPSDLKAKEPDINWRRLADLGNRLRHAYHRTDAGLLWSMIEDDLEPLNRFIEKIGKGSDH